MAMAPRKSRFNRKENTFSLPDGTTLYNVHERSDTCEQSCVIHNPLTNHMSDWQLHWRNDRGIFERICPHGIGHPEPSQYPYWDATHQGHQKVHGCDGCCVSG